MNLKWFALRKYILKLYCVNITSYAVVFLALGIKNKNLVRRLFTEYGGIKVSDI